MLYISTRVWVLGTPRACQNLHFCMISMQKKINEANAYIHFLSLSKMLVNTIMLVNKLNEKHNFWWKLWKRFYSWNKTLLQPLDANPPKNFCWVLHQCSCFFLLFTLFSFLHKKHWKSIFWPLLECMAPKRWLKYSTNITD